MKLRSRIFWAVVWAAGLAAFSSSALAKSVGYCLECHSAQYLQSAGNPAAAADRSVYQARLDPCPGLRSRAEEMYFTESRIVKNREILRFMSRDDWNTDSLESRVGSAGEAFSLLKKESFPSIGELARESFSLRSALQKVYDRTVQSRAESDRRWLIGVGALCFLGLLILLGVGFRKLSRMGKIGLLLLLASGATLLGACSSAPLEAARKSPAQESLDQSLSVASQAGARVEEGFYQSILLAQAARDWSRIDRPAAEKAFHLAWKMALAAGEEGGKLRAFREMVARWPDRTSALKEKVNYDAVLDLRDEVRSADSRAWGMRAVAEEWLRVSEKDGRQALELASRKAAEIRDPEIRDRDLMSLAEAWNAVDGKRAWEVSGSIADPASKAYSLTRLALSGRNQDRAGNLLREAWKSAESIQAPYSRAQARIRIAAAAAGISPADKKYWAEQALADIRRLEPLQAREAALGEMIFLWSRVDGEMAEGWAGTIPLQQSEARAYAFLALAQRPGIPAAKAKALIAKVLETAQEVPDAFESRKIFSRACQGLAKLDPQAALSLLGQIPDPFYRSEILEQMAEDISAANPRMAAEIAEKIPQEAWRGRVTARILAGSAGKDREKVQALYREAFQAAQSIPDPHPRALILFELGKEWGAVEKGKEPAVWDMALKAGEGIAVPSDRAQIMEMLAAGWKPSDPGRSQAILDRIEPSAAAVRRTLEEVRLWGKSDPGRAQQYAEAIPPSFPYERVLALKEVAGQWKKTQPKLALGILGKAIQQAPSIPEGERKRKLLSGLVAEASSLDREATLQWISLVPEASTRNLLYSDAGAAWAGEDPAQVMKAAKGISESTPRTVLLQRAADSAAKRSGNGKPEEPLSQALKPWGRGRETAKREETKAAPFFQQALGEIERLKDPGERAFLLAGLAADWARIDEKKAREVAEKIGAKEFAEPYSYALLRIAAQYGMWSRKEAEASFSQTLSAAENISDPSVRAIRLLQISREWKTIDEGKGREVLTRALGDARKSGGQDDALLRVLLAQAAWSPEETAAAAKVAASPALRARVLLECARMLKARTIDDRIKTLDKAFLLAQKEKNYRLMAEVAGAAFVLAPQKGLEIQRQIEPRDLRIQTLRRMARSSAAAGNKEEAKGLLEQASEEAAKGGGTAERLRFLRDIAADLAAIDPERAKAAYLKAYRIAEKEFLAKPGV